MSIAKSSSKAGNRKRKRCEYVLDEDICNGFATDGCGWKSGWVRGGKCVNLMEAQACWKTKKPVRVLEMLAANDQAEDFIHDGTETLKRVTSRAKELHVLAKEHAQYYTISKAQKVPDKRWWQTSTKTKLQQIWASWCIFLSAEVDEWIVQGLAACKADGGGGPKWGAKDGVRDESVRDFANELANAIKAADKLQATVGTVVTWVNGNKTFYPDPKSLGLRAAKKGGQLFSWVKSNAGQTVEKVKQWKRPTPPNSKPSSKQKQNTNE